MSINFSQTRTEIIEDAYTLLGILGAGQTLRADDMSLGVRLFNKLVKTYQAQGGHLWNKEEAYLFLDKNVADYYLGDQATIPAKACYREDAILTTLYADASAAATALTVVTTVGMTIGDYIGVVLSDNTLYWTTIATIPTTTTLTLTTGLSGASSANKNVYTFTTLIDKPLKITSVRRVYGTVTNPTATEINNFSHDDFYRQPNRNLSSTPLNFYYQPRKTYGQFHIWPASNTSQNYLEFTMERGLQDLDTATDVPDFPDEWLEPLTYQLAIRLAPAFGKEDKAAKLIIPLGGELINGVLAFDSENNSINIMPEMRQ